MGWRAVQPPHIAAGLLLLLLVNLPGIHYFLFTIRVTFHFLAWLLGIESK